MFYAKVPFNTPTCGETFASCAEEKDVSGELFKTLKLWHEKDRGIVKQLSKTMESCGIRKIAWEKILAQALDFKL